MKKHNKIIFISFAVITSLFLIYTIIAFVFLDEFKEGTLSYLTSFSLVGLFLLSVNLLGFTKLYRKLPCRITINILLLILPILLCIGCGFCCYDNSHICVKKYYKIIDGVRYDYRIWRDLSPAFIPLAIFTLLLAILALINLIWDTIPPLISKSKKKKLKKAAPVILTKLKELYDKKIITEEEYAEKRKKYADML